MNAILLFLLISTNSIYAAQLSPPHEPKTPRIDLTPILSAEVDRSLYAQESAIGLVQQVRWDLEAADIRLQRVVKALDSSDSDAAPFRDHLVQELMDILTEAREMHTSIKIAQRTLSDNVLYTAEEVVEMSRREVFNLYISTKLQLLQLGMGVTCDQEMDALV